MKRLFKLEGGAVTVYFDNKMRAKEIRDIANRENPKGPRAVVSLGPDHRNYKGR